MKPEAITALMTMFNCFNFGGDADEKQIKIEAYIAALDDLDSETVVRVCTLAARGKIGDGKFMPTAGELHQAAGAEKPQKPSPDWRPHQDRLLTKDGTLFLTENGRTWTYSAEELQGHGYALPARIAAQQAPQIADARVAGLISDAAKNRRA
jgi:hypothetical protein